MSSNVGLGEGSVGGEYLDAVVGAMLHGCRHGVDKRLAAVGVDGVIAGMVGNHNSVQAVALSDSTGDGQHDAVAEGHDSCLHVFVIVVALGDSIGALEQCALEVAMHEVERYDDVLDTQSLALLDCILLLAVVLR